MIRYYLIIEIELKKKLLNCIGIIDCIGFRNKFKVLQKHTKEGFLKKGKLKLNIVVLI